MLSLTRSLDAETRIWIATSQVREDVDDLWRFQYMLVIGWGVVAGICAVSFGALAVCVKLAGLPTSWGTALFGLAAFGIGFSAVGGLDAYWRRLLLRSARERWETQGRQFDDRTRSLVRRSAIPTYTLVFQIAAG